MKFIKKHTQHIVMLGVLVALVAALFVSGGANNNKEGANTASSTQSIATTTEKEGITQKASNSGEKEQMVVERETIEGKTKDGETGSIVITDITNQELGKKGTINTYKNESLGISFKYAEDWMINNSSRPGAYTFRVEKLNTQNPIQASVRIYNATVSEADNKRTTFAGEMAFERKRTDCILYSDFACVVYVITVPQEEGITENGMWKGKVVELTYGVYSYFPAEESTKSALNPDTINKSLDLEKKFTTYKSDFDVILNSFLFINLK